MIRSLPLVNAVLNGTAAVLLVCGLVAIRARRQHAHERFMKAALCVSVLFLVSYLIYHAKAQATKYTGEWPRAYYTMLISHVILAAINLPMILITFRHALTQRWDKHRRIARWTFPVWLYVSVTGVAIYVWLYVV